MPLVDPTADSFSAQRVAPRPADLDEALVGLVDGMLNPVADWGQGLLDAAQEHLVGQFPRIRFERVSRPQVAASSPEVWAETMAERYAALVVAAGD